MSVKDHPGNILRWHRGTNIFRKLRYFRTASERTNSTFKDDLELLDKPKVRGKKRAMIVDQLAAIGGLFKSLFSFICKVTHHLTRFRETKNPEDLDKLRGPPVEP